MTHRDSEHEPDAFDDVPELDDRLADWVDGCMSDRDRERFEAEMRVSKPLREQAERYRATVDSVRAALQAPTRDVDLADRVMAKLAQQQNEPRVAGARIWPMIGAITTAAALLGIAIWVDAFGSSPRATGEDEDLVAVAPLEAPVVTTVDGEQGDGVTGESASADKSVLRLSTENEERAEENAASQADQKVVVDETAKLGRVAQADPDVQADPEEGRKASGNALREQARGPGDVTPPSVPEKNAGKAKKASEAEAEPSESLRERSGAIRDRGTSRQVERKPAGPAGSARSSGPSGPTGRPPVRPQPGARPGSRGPAGPGGPATGGPTGPAVRGPSGPGAGPAGPTTGGAPLESGPPAGGVRGGRGGHAEEQHAEEQWAAGEGENRARRMMRQRGRTATRSDRVRLVDNDRDGQLLPMLIVESAQAPNIGVGGGGGRPRSKAAEAKPPKPTTAAPEPGQSKAGESKAGESKAGESKTGESKAGGSKAGTPRGGAPTADAPRSDEREAATPKADTPTTGATGGGAKTTGAAADDEDPEAPLRLDVRSFFDGQGGARTGADDFFLGSRRKAEQLPLAGLARQRSVVVGSVRVQAIARATRAATTGDETVEHDWLVEGPRDEVARFLAEVRRLAKQQQRTCRGGEARVAMPDRSANKTAPATPEAASTEAEAEAEAAKSRQRESTKQQAIERVVLRFRFPSR